MTGKVRVAYKQRNKIGAYYFTVNSLRKCVLNYKVFFPSLEVVQAVHILFTLIFIATTTKKLNFTTLSTKNILFLIEQKMIKVVKTFTLLVNLCLSIT